VHPDGAGPYGDRVLGRLSCRAALRDEIVVQGDGIHPPGPDQQRVGRVRSAEIAVAAALDDQPQIVVTREVDRRDNVMRRFGRNGIDARLKVPGIDPAGGLRQADLVADEIGVFQFPEEIAARSSIRRFPTDAQRRAHLDEATPDIFVQLGPARFVRPSGVGWAGTTSRRILGQSRPQRVEQRRHESERCRALEQASSVHRQFSEADVDSALDGLWTRCAAVERPSTMIAAMGFPPAG
jgi:hypothetical protein